MDLRINKSFYNKKEDLFKKILNQIYVFLNDLKLKKRKGKELNLFIP